MAGGGGIDDGGAQVRRGNPRWRRRLEAPQSNSFDGEAAGGDGDLLSSSERQGEARNDGLRRQPWWFELCTGNEHLRKRERPGKKEGGRPGRVRRGRRGFEGSLQGVDEEA
jgi:hypothetical protein